MQRCPTHSPLATCGEWTFECGEWLNFQIAMFWTKKKFLFKIFYFNSHFSVKTSYQLMSWPRMYFLICSWILNCVRKGIAGYLLSWPRMYLLKFSWILNCVRKGIARTLVNSIFKMWRMARFIRHICGEPKNTLGHRWVRRFKSDFSQQNHVDENKS